MTALYLIPIIVTIATAFSRVAAIRRKSIACDCDAASYRTCWSGCHVKASSIKPDICSRPVASWNTIIRSAQVP
mgnify:CR=1 FL=1